ncbi:MAG: hypothetical protein J7493_10220 [Porphyrobacter sp.]|nr:hypothetical protein [Porphyrobacter sp.]
MKPYRSALCWAAAIIGVALAGMFDVIDQASTTTLLIALPVAGWMAVSGRGSCPLARER